MIKWHSYLWITKCDRSIPNQHHPQLSNREITITNLIIQIVRESAFRSPLIPPIFWTDLLCMKHDEARKTPETFYLNRAKSRLNNWNSPGARQLRLNIPQHKAIVDLNYVSEEDTYRALALSTIWILSIWTRWNSIKPFFNLFQSSSCCITA